MRRWAFWMCVGGLAAAIAAPPLCAQNSSGRRNQNGVPVADQFVSTPGQRVTTPGQSVAGPGQRVTTPGQMVIPPGQLVMAPGQSISPTPGVMAPFHSQTQESLGQAEPRQTRKHGVTPGRKHHNRRTYRPEYGAVLGYAVPYSVSRGYAPGIATGTEKQSSSATEGRTLFGVSGHASFGAAAPSVRLAHAPSGNRPPYRGAEAPSVGPNVIQSEEPVLTVVMKDGVRRKVRNYALTPKMLIDLDEAASGKEMEIPLSRINVAATEKAAAQAGLSFAVPTS